ncbi:MAG: flagellar hook-associated protein FlgK [Opitutaceae bacterium]|nr:flagellar hook-associated protein FlgK [Opitutaceae bacterium]
MPGLYASINTTVKALTAHSRAIEVTGKNLANVNNPDYARQRVVYGDRGMIETPMGPESLGLEALGIEQVRDAMLDRQLVREIGLKGSVEAQQSAFRRAQAGLGESIDRASSANESSATAGNGVAAAIDDFFNAFQSFAARPTDGGERQTLLQKAGILTDRFRLADERLDRVQSDLDSLISSDVAAVNRTLSTLAEINSQIGRFELHAPGSAIDLRDQRQALLEQLSAKLPIEYSELPGGQLQIVAKDGVGADIVLVDGPAVQGTVAFTGTGLTAGSPATAVALAGGSIHGSLTARDGTVQTLRDELDALARQLVIAVNDAYNPTGATGDFFAAAGLSAAAFAVDSSVTVANLKASDGGAAGNNTVALAVAALAHQTFSTAGGDEIDGTLSGFFGQSVIKLGEALATATARVEDQAGIERLVRGQRDAVSGVSLDEEMANLVKYQRSFQASSRVFTVLDQLLDNVVNQLGRV